MTDNGIGLSPAALAALQNRLISSAAAAPLVQTRGSVLISVVYGITNR
jgi:hypothetical protein